MPQVKYHTVHKYGEQKRSRSKQLADARAKKKCVEPLKEIFDNNKENTNDEYDSDSTVIYTPHKPTLPSRTEEKLKTMANALPSGDSPSTGKIIASNAKQQ